MLPVVRNIKPARILSASYCKPRMATTKASLPHVERTAEDPRDNSLHTVKISQVDYINSKIRLYQLTPISAPIKFLPGQWLDVYCPSIPEAGGFTITSPPTITSYVELAIQKSPESNSAKWLWQDPPTILGQELKIRVGGAFVWPPKLGEGNGVKRAVFVAGGVGINPLMSMVSFIAGEKESGRLGELKEIKFLYSTKKEEREDILFLTRLVDVFKVLGQEGELRLFLTGSTEGNTADAQMIGQKVAAKRRIQEEDLLETLGPAEERGSTVCYICGVPTMTDQFIDQARKAEGMLEENVLFEKWW